MGIEIIEGYEAGDDVHEKAVLFCNTTGWAFGPVFDGHEAAEDFLWFASRQGCFDVRKLAQAELAELVDRWRAHRKDLPLDDAHFCWECGNEQAHAAFKKVQNIDGEDLCPQCGSDAIVPSTHILS